MGASHKTKIRKVRGSSSRTFWSVPLPRIEARALFQFLGRGETLEAIRELIAVPREAEQLPRDDASEHSEDRQGLERVAEFGRLVGQGFERLYRSQRNDP